jgi:DNA-binding CsgD family transcriptional regulator
MPDSRTSLFISSLKAWSDGCARIIETIDEPDTPRRLCAALCDLVPIDFSGVFVLRRHAAPIAVLDDIPPGTEARSYLESLYLLDPVYDRFLRGSLPTCALLDDICPDDFFESDYFQQYWSNVNIVSEFSINTHCDADTVLHVPLSRVGGSKRFSKNEIATLTAVSGTVVAVMRRFWEARRAGFESSATQADSFHVHLRYVMDNFGCSLLTAREMDIMQLTMRGYSDKLSARELDITPGTVRNHKKSIFNKLQVSSQGQVFGLLLDALQLPADEAIGSDPLATLLERRI